MGARYATVEALCESLDFEQSTRRTREVLRALDAGSRAVDSLCARNDGGFWPEVRTRRFDWPAPSSPEPTRVWLGEPELVSLTSLTSGGTALDVGSFILYPDTGPPYDHLEVDRSTSVSLGLGETPQNDVAITGVWGHDLVVERAGSLDAAVSSTTGNVVDVTDGAGVGVGDLLTIDSERVEVVGRSWLDSGQNTGGALTDSSADVALPVVDGTAFNVGERLLLESERMRIEDIAANTLTVARAVDGTVLAAHGSGLDLFVGRRLTVTRGAYGTTAATHADAAAVYRQVYPALVQQLALAEAAVYLQQQAAGWASTSGSGAAKADATGVGIEGLRERCRRAHGRSTRHQAV